MAQLRDFYGYNKTAAFNPTLLYGNTTNFACTLTTLDGVAAGAGYLQIHDVADPTTLTGASVPLKSIRVTAAGPIPSVFGVLGGVTLFNGLTIAFSSAEEVYTASATRIDVFGQIDEYERTLIGVTNVGDLTTAVNGLVVWANTGAKEGGLHSLMEITATNSTGATGYLMLFTYTSADGDTPLLTATFASAQTRKLRFGTLGLAPYTRTAAQAIRDGCILIGSSTPAVRAITAANWTIQARYIS